MGKGIVLSWLHSSTSVSLNSLYYTVPDSLTCISGVMLILVCSHSSAARAGSSVSSSMIPPYPGSVARARDRVQALQAYSQQPSNTPAMRTPVMSGARRSSIHRGPGQVTGQVASSSDQTGGFYFFPSGSSG